MRVVGAEAVRVARRLGLAESGWRTWNICTLQQDTSVPGDGIGNYIG
jgi:hypothetical protein